MAPTSTRKVTLTPKAGFVIKTTSTVDGAYSTRLDANGTDSGQSPKIIPVTKGYKIFLNICWDSNVPPPPERTEDQIRRAMMGADLDEGVYFVPVVVSDGKPTNDKAGKPSLVFDCVFNSTLRGRSTKDPEFRTFLTEIALERVEDKSGLTLSREVATPNISSKGTLEPRTVSIPAVNTPSSKPLIQEVEKATIQKEPVASKPLIQEVTEPIARPKAIQPSWSAEVEKSGITITLDVPKLTKASPTSLDIEAHQIIFQSPNLYELDLRLSDKGKLSAVSSPIDQDTAVLGGKGMKPDGATAKLRVAEKQLVIKVPWD